MLSVPFATGDIHGGFSEGRGAIRVDDDEVVIEVQVKLFGLFKRPAQTFRFELTDLEDVRHRRGVFRDSLTIRTRPMETATRIPGSANGARRRSARRSASPMTVRRNCSNCR